MSKHRLSNKEQHSLFFSKWLYYKWITYVNFSVSYGCLCKELPLIFPFAFMLIFTCPYYYHYISKILRNYIFQEQALYEKEGLNVKRIEWTDNQDCIGRNCYYLR